jgi:hypothetical protein
MSVPVHPPITTADRELLLAAVPELAAPAPSAPAPVVPETLDRALESVILGAAAGDRLRKHILRRVIRRLALESVIDLDDAKAVTTLVLDALGAPDGGLRSPPRGTRSAGSPRSFATTRRCDATIGGASAGRSGTRARTDSIPLRPGASRGSRGSPLAERRTDDPTEEIDVTRSIRSRETEAHQLPSMRGTTTRHPASLASPLRPSTRGIP